MKKFNIRKMILLLADVFIILVSGITLNYILSLSQVILPEGNRGVFYYSPEASRGLLYYLVIYVLTCELMMLLFGSYSRMWRYFNKIDYLMCAAAMTLGFGTGYMVLVFMNRAPRKIFSVLFYLAATAGVLLFRLMFKSAFLKIAEDGGAEKTERTLIVGAGNAGRMILTEIRNAESSPGHHAAGIFPVCMVDDDTTKLNKRIMGVEVAGVCAEIPKICEEQKIESIIVAIPSCEEDEKRKILSYCSATSCKIKIVPYLSDLLLNDAQPQLLQQVKEIRIEDLLGRKPIEFNRVKIAQFICGKVCMVTGGGGSIGSELVRQIAQYSPKQIIIVDIYENNAYDIQQELKLEYGDTLNLVTIIASVRDYNKMDSIFKEYLPQVVFHAAAHKHVPLMETVPEEAVKNNIFGTFNVATLAEFYQVDKFVMISTDKAVNPTNVMGATKRACEMIIQYKAQTSTHTEFVTTRFGNVLGSNGSVIPLFRRQIENNMPVTVTHPDIIRYFMTIPEAVSLVLEAGAMAKGGEIFVLDMGAPVKITTLAENLIRMYGKVPYKDVQIVFTGLRPGEKLFEELLMDEEGLKSTENKKIFIGNQITIEPGEMLRKLHGLRISAESNDSEKTVQLLSELVPTFHHQDN